MLKLKLLSAKPSKEDGFRVFNEKSLPKGVTLKSANIDSWPKSFIPNLALTPKTSWDTFSRNYRKQLKAPATKKLVAQLAKQSETENVTLLYTSANPNKSYASVLMGEIDEHVRLRPEALREFDTLTYIAARLRAPDGCPWDKAQSHESLGKYLIEETYETLDAIEGSSKRNLREELGDVLLQIALHSQIASENKDFNFNDVIEGLNRKLILRHPHVFGDEIAESPEEVERNWEKNKKKEKKTKSVLEGMSRAMPGLSYSQEAQHRAARIGFEWPDISGVWEKFDEEMNELRNAKNQAEREHEMGDIFTSLVNICRFMKIDPEQAVRKANQRFYNRFTLVEKMTSDSGMDITKSSLDQLNVLWEKAKLQLKDNVY
ncbi:MAG: nucleoside triphosphate pyrophosphohydrolase [Dehalococcoidia bacterium]|nr:nucleoside triphosphate pyrophosphohydrolase [Dehalococcoidia bacterium]